MADFKPLNLVICLNYQDANDHLSVSYWPKRWGKAIRIDLIRCIVETETDRYYLFYKDDARELWSIQIKEYFITDAAHLRTDLRDIILEAFKRRRIQALKY